MMLFFVCAPTKTQRVLGSNPSRITQSFKSILFLRMLACFYWCPDQKRNGAWVRTPAESQLSVLIREQGVETWLEASTERSESNPGQSLGIIKHGGTAVWKTVPPHDQASASIRFLC